MFVGIAAATLLVALAFPKSVGIQRKSVLYWVLPIVFGAVLVSPFNVNQSQLICAIWLLDEIILKCESTIDSAGFLPWLSIVVFCLFS